MCQRCRHRLGAGGIGIEVSGYVRGCLGCDGRSVYSQVKYYPTHFKRVNIQL